MSCRRERSISSMSVWEQALLFMPQWIMCHKQPWAAEWAVSIIHKHMLIEQGCNYSTQFHFYEVLGCPTPPFFFKPITTLKYQWRVLNAVSSRALSGGRHGPWLASRLSTQASSGAGMRWTRLLLVWICLGNGWEGGRLASSERRWSQF